MGSSSTATTAGSAASRKKLSPVALEWAKRERQISQETLEKLPVASGTAFFGDLQAKSQALFFQYGHGWKARAFPQKAFTAETGTEVTFWNLEAVLNGPLKDVYIVEGELDACALVEAGLRPDQVLAAPSATSGKLGYVEDALKAGLGRAARFIFCGDMDAPGIALRADMAAIIGAARFCFLDWPDGSKDANDNLCAEHPKEMLDRLLLGFKVWPTDGLFRLSAIPDAAPLTVWEPGFSEWGDKLRLAAGTLSVVTGHPGMGKTLLMTQLWFQILRRYDLTACVASFETRPKPHLIRQLRTLHARKLESVMTRDEIIEADQWIEEHYLFLVHPERRPSLPWLLKQAEVAVIRDNARVLIVDPWNRLEASRGVGENETEYIGRCLRELYNFANDFGCHVQIIAHPAKMDSSFRRGEPPELEHIAGSKHWDNMVDQGFVVHRPKLFNDRGDRETYCELLHRKARFEELGYATKFGLDYDISMGRYGPCSLKQKRAPMPTPHEQFDGGQHDATSH